MSNEEINQKAKELVDKFVALDNDIFCLINYPYSKQCALIDIENTIDTLNDILKLTYNSVVAKKLGECISIKQAIEKL